MRLSPETAAVIANGATESAEVDLGSPYECIRFHIPAITGATGTVQVAMTTGGTFYTLSKSDGTAAITFAKSLAHVANIGGAQYIKITSASSEGAERTIPVQGFNP